MSSGNYGVSVSLTGDTPLVRNRIWSMTNVRQRGMRLESRAPWFVNLSKHFLGPRALVGSGGKAQNFAHVQFLIAKPLPAALLSVSLSPC